MSVEVGDAVVEPVDEVGQLCAGGGQVCAFGGRFGVVSGLACLLDEAGDLGDRVVEFAAGDASRPAGGCVSHRRGATVLGLATGVLVEVVDVRAGGLAAVCTVACGGVHGGILR